MCVEREESGGRENDAETDGDKEESGERRGGGGCSLLSLSYRAESRNTNLVKRILKPREARKVRVKKTACSQKSHVTSLLQA